MSIFEDYIQFHNKGVELYGEKTTVFMEVGSFFEIYSVINDDEHVGADIYTICDLFNIQVTRKNKSINTISRSNHLMAGFPSHSVKKFIDILLYNNYTILIVEQVTPPPKSKRNITQILSPSTYIDAVRNYESNIMMTIYLENIKAYKQNEKYHVFGWSIFDATTGVSYCNEVTSIYDDKLLMDELYRIVLVYNPREIVLISKDNGILKENMIRYLDLDNRCVHNKINQMSKKYTEIKYQNEILTKVFKNIGLLSPIEYLDLEYKHFALISFVYMIQFVYEHGENLLSKLNKPIISDNNENKLILAFNALNQLNMTSKNTNLLNLLNTCSTSVGKRFFKRTLLNPITSTSELNERYNNIECLLHTQAWTVVKKDLDMVNDIERMFRKIACNNINPSELASLFSSLDKLHTVFSKLYEIPEIQKQYKKLGTYTDIYVKFKEYCENTLITSNLQKYTIDNIYDNFFCKGIYTDLDDLYQDKELVKTKLVNLVHVVDSKHDTLNWLKLDCNEREGYHYVITNKRWVLLKKKLHLYEDDVKEYVLKLTPFTTNSNNVRLTSDYIKMLNKDLQVREKTLQELSLKYYKDFLNYIHEQFADCFFKHMVELLEYVDFYLTCAKNAFKYSLSKPTIIKKDSSYVNLENVRHLLIENVQKNIEYTPNNIYIGEASSSEQNGMILFGVNASGKSSFMKSVGLAIIQAQSGMYVPCESMTYSPYDYVFTRIQSTDDIVKGMSTFSNEISELRNIFKVANNKSIIIGDELCAGTESISALAIVTAGIETLSNMKTSFIFATHLHELNNLKRINNLMDANKITIKHLSVEYDYEKGILIYDRKIKNGPGSSLYGGEVCKAMDMSTSFIQLASIIRHEITNSTHEFVREKVSRYNSKTIIDRCGICDSTKNLETHHIKFQKDAKNSIIENRFHKNAQFNLVPLCNECHDMVHNNKIIISGWKTTSVGVKLDTYYTINGS
jgi:DNA mismatch repair protein MutS